MLLSTINVITAASFLLGLDQGGFFFLQRKANGFLLRGSIVNQIGPNIGGKNSEIYRFLSVPYRSYLIWSPRKSNAHCVIGG